MPVTGTNITGNRRSFSTRARPATMHRMRDLPYTRTEVRDLAWALCSPALLRRNDANVRWPGATWFDSLCSHFHDTLVQLNAEPRTLCETLARRRDRRLGNYFETLWRYWLEHNPRYLLLYANLPVRAGGTTLGEFDLLVHDRERGKTLHWELAVKFYLGVGDTSQPCNWWGPGRRDRLDIKTDRLLQHQSQLSRRSEARALISQQGLRIDETWVIMKGRLFYPRFGEYPPPRGANPQHLRGFWLPAQQLSMLGRRRWLILDRHQWFAPVSDTSAATLETLELLDWWNTGQPTYPVCIAAMIEGCEQERGFIVPGDWDQGGSQPW